MKKFFNVMESTLKDTGLKKVKLKIDPAFCTDQQIKKFQGYEGYILAEDEGVCKFYVESCCEHNGTIINIPLGMVDVQQSLSPLEKLKLKALEYLKANKNLQKDDALTAVIISAPSHECLEAYLYNNGCADCDLLDIYRELFVSTL
jgi:hypothetical protein